MRFAAERACRSSMARSLRSLRFTSAAGSPLAGL